MALDTRDKRASAILGRTLPGPDGTIDAADRLHVAGLYRGIAADEPESVVGPLRFASTAYASGPDPFASVVYPSGPDPFASTAT